MLPVLYSFRRCPYAIRARYVLASIGIQVELREVILKSKPESLLMLGGRSTVPQLVDIDDSRYPESLDIIFWGLSKERKSASLIWPSDTSEQNKMLLWIRYNDNFFKYWLDRYKYADRYPDYEEQHYRQKSELFLKKLEVRLSRSAYLFGSNMSLADMAIFPFIRQFAAVDRDWFESVQWTAVKKWLSCMTESDFFKDIVMKKYSAWEAGQDLVVFPENRLNFSL